ncbi:MAG: S41 family peptidase [Bdellovibrionota bacterium]
MTKFRIVFCSLFITIFFTFSSSQAQSMSASKIFGQYAKKDTYERLNQVLYFVHSQYVEPTRINFSNMFTSAVKELSLNLAELSYTKKKQTITVTLINQSKTFSTKIPSIYALRNQLNDLLAFVEAHKKTQSKEGTIEENAISGLLNTLDPHSVFLSKDILSETNVDIEGKFGGLGIVIGFREGNLTVISPIDGTPAAKKGIEAGDRIVKIEEEPTTGMTLFEAVSKMRGERGTFVNIAILREGNAKEIPFTIKRDVIEIINIDSALLSNNIGYIKLKRFDKSAAKDIAYEIQNFQSTLGKELNGLILDLRNNPGGLLDQAIDVSDLFLQEGGIVSTVERNNKFNSRTKAKKSGRDFIYPMTLLINQGSASASEIVAGALQKNNRALLIGQKTFGKGTVQKIFGLPKDTALKLTVSKYLTVDDISIQSIGIRPDIETQPVWVKDDFVRFQQYLKFRSESDLDQSFANYEKANKSLIALPYLVPIQDEAVGGQSIVDEYQFSKLSSKEKEEKLMQTFEIELAHTILSQDRVKNLSRTELFQNAKGAIAKLEKNEQNQIQLALSKKGINWTYPPKPSTYCNPKKLSITTTPTIPKAGFQDNSKIELVTKIKNNNDCSFYQVKGITESKNPVFDQHFIYIGHIQPQQEVSITSSIDVPDYQAKGVELLQVVMSDSEGQDIHHQNIQIPFAKQNQPEFKVSYTQSKSGVKQELSFNIENTGNAISNETLLVIKQKGTKTLELTTSRQVVKDLKPGQKQTVHFPIKQANVNASNEPVIVTVQCADVQNRVFLEQDINLSKPHPNGVIQAPKIELATEKFLSVVGKHAITLTGTIEDDQEIKDMYIFVNDEKVYYQLFPLKSSKENFSVDLPLSEQENVIQIISRDTNDTQGSTEVHILRNI